LNTHPHLIVCEHCDCVYRRPRLTRRQRAHCTVCGLPLACRAPLHEERALALNIASVIAFLLVITCPVIQVDIWGRHTDATLWQAAMALTQGVGAPIAVPVAAILLVPLGLSLLQCWVLGFASTNKTAPAFATAMRLIAWLRPWSMIEVCLLSVLIAMIKLSGYLEVHAGAGLWALAALTLLNGYLGTQDLRTLWEPPT